MTRVVEQATKALIAAQIADLCSYESAEAQRVVLGHIRRFVEQETPEVAVASVKGALDALTEWQDAS